MVKAFKTLADYPGTYDPQKMAEHQSPVPSQNIMVPKPFYPGRGVDIRTGPPKGGTAPNASYVRGMFDSRPPYCTDFIFSDVFISKATIFDGFNVPAGYTAILRQLSVLISVNGSIYSSGGILSPYGTIDTVTNIPQINLLLNGVAQAGWVIPRGNNQSVNLFGGLGSVSGVLSPDSLTVGEEFDTFFVVPENSTCGISIPGFTDNTDYNVYVEYRGNLLLSDGRLSTLQVGNSGPEPVEIISNA